MAMRVWLIQRNKIWDHYSARRFRQAAEQRSWKFQILQPDQVDVGVAVGDSLRLDGAPSEPPELILPRMGANTTPWAAQILSRLETQGVPVVNNTAAVLKARDKFQSLQLLETQGLPVPPTVLGRLSTDFERLAEVVKFPLVFKTLNGLQGRSVFLCETPEQLQEILQFMHDLAPEALFILQSFVSESRGRDLRVLVIGDRAVAAMERRAPPGEFKANLARGGRALPFPLTSEARDLAVRAVKVLGLEYAGVDLLFGPAGFLVCEVNSSPGFEGLESVCGCRVPEALYDFLEESF